MARYWFLSAPLFSHLDWGGFLKTAIALKAREHEVTWISENAVGGAVTSAGIAFAPVRATGWLWPPPPAPDVRSIPPQEAVMLRYRRALDTWLSVDRVADAVQAILDLVDPLGTPDVIVTDPFLTAAALAAEAIGAKLAVCGWVAQRDLNAELLFPVQRTLGSDSQERLRTLYDQFGLTGSNFSQGATPSIISPHLHIAYFSPTWYQAEAETILPQTRCVGGRRADPAPAPPPWLAGLPPTVPIALITLGTTFTGDLGFFAWAAQAAARAGFLPVVALGLTPLDDAQKAELKAALPPRTILVNYIPFDQILPRTAIIAHHGGMGTTHAALLHGLPQIIVPHAADQRAQARRAAQAKVGLNLTAHDVRQGVLRDAFRALRTDAAVAANARALAEEMAALGGIPRAAQLLDDLA